MKKVNKNRIHPTTEVRGLSAQIVVKYTYWTGMYKKINVREDGYDIITSYKLRWWHPFNWILTLVAILAGTFHLAIEIIKENNDEFQIREDKKMDS